MPLEFEEQTGNEPLGTSPAPPTCRNHLFINRAAKTFSLSWCRPTTRFPHLLAPAPQIQAEKVRHGRWCTKTGGTYGRASQDFGCLHHRPGHNSCGVFVPSGSGGASAASHNSLSLPPKPPQPFTQHCTAQSDRQVSHDCHIGLKPVTADCFSSASCCWGKCIHLH